MARRIILDHPFISVFREIETRATVAHFGTVRSGRTDYLDGVTASRHRERPEMRKRTSRHRRVCP
jgi:hypothetical protein